DIPRLAVEAPRSRQAPPPAAAPVPGAALGKRRPRPHSNPLVPFDDEAEHVARVEVDPASRFRVAPGEEIDLGAVRREADSGVEPAEKAPDAPPELPAELDLERADEHREAASLKIGADSPGEPLQRPVLLPRQPPLDSGADAGALDGECEVVLFRVKSIGRRDHRGKHL